MSNRHITQHQAAYVLDRDQTYQLNARMVIHCQREGVITPQQAVQNIEWLKQSAMRRHRRAEFLHTGLVRVQDSWRNGGHHD